MWPFNRAPTKEQLQDRKVVSIHGHKFVIRKINPLADFTADRMPQIFASSFSTVRSVLREGEKPHLEYARRVHKDMQAVVEAGLVEPDLVPVGQGERKGKEVGITIEDISRDSETFTKLYWEIWLHSLSRFKGLRNFFFNLRLRYLLWTALRGVTVGSPLTSPGLTGASQ